MADRYQVQRDGEAPLFFANRRHEVVAVAEHILPGHYIELLDRQASWGKPNKWVLIGGKWIVGHVAGE
jgi:hypothetical protein